MREKLVAAEKILKMLDEAKNCYINEAFPEKQIEDSSLYAQQANRLMGFLLAFSTAENIVKALRDSDAE